MPENARVQSQAKQIKEIAENLVVSAARYGLAVTIKDDQVEVVPRQPNQGEESE